MKTKFLISGSKRLYDRQGGQTIDLDEKSHLLRVYLSILILVQLTIDTYHSNKQTAPIADFVLGRYASSADILRLN